MNKFKLFLSLVVLITINDAFSQVSPGTNYDINYHHLEFEVDPSVHYIKGKVTTYFSILEDDVSQIVFDMASVLKVDSIIYHSEKINYSHSSNKLAIQLPSTLPLHKSDSVKVYYQGAPPSSGGFGAFITDSHNRTPIMWTLSEPYGAKDWWPCKQDLYDKADSIDLIIIHPKEYKAAGNGVLLSETIIGENKRTHWKHRHPITAYLVAFAVTNYETYSDYVPLDDNDSIQILNYVYPEDLDNAREQTPATIEIMKLFNKLFITYPYKDEKYGHAQFGWGGGMEHQTMSFMVNFNFDLIAHELAHQWFGDYITCNSWKNIWINEGFATYCESLCHEFGLSGQNWNNYKENQIRYITSEPGGSLYVNDTTSDYSIFNGRLSYAKGGMVLHMLRNEVGDTAFFRGIRNYLQDPKLANGFASTENFQEHIEAESGMDLNYFFQDWIYGQGYPKYTISWNQGGDLTGSVVIEQTQSHPTVDFFELNVPVKFAGEGQDTVLFFRNTEKIQLFPWQLNFKVNTIYFDPDHWLISRNPVIQNVKSPNLEDLLTISPNPVKNELNVKLKDSLQFNSVTVHGISGKLLIDFGETDFNNEFNFNLKKLKSGLYFMVLKSAKGDVIKKIIKD